MMKKVAIVIVGALMLLSSPKAISQLSNVDGTWSFGGGFTGFSLGGADIQKVRDKGFNSMIPGFYFGASLDYAFSSVDGLTVEPGAYLAHYGKTFKFGTGESDHKAYHANYLTIPLNLKYAFPMDDSSFGMAVYTGPRFNIGVGGNMFSTGKNYPGLKPVDAQWGFGLAVTVAEAIVLRGDYAICLTNSLRDNKDLDFNDLIIRRNSFFLGVNFLFK